jgi:(S)-ureidoglycine aminohydrolase
MKYILLIVLSVINLNVFAQNNTLLGGVFKLDELTKIEDNNLIRIPVIKNLSSTFLENISIHHTELKPGHALRASHKQIINEELIIIEEGNLTVTVNNKTKILGPGSVLIILPGDEQTINNLSDKNTSYLVFIYKGKKQTADSLKGKSLVLDWQETVLKTHDKGGRRDFFDRPTSATIRFEMHVTSLNVGLKSHEPHKHLAEEFIFMFNGQAKMNVGGITYNGKKGDLFFLPSNQFHNLINTGNEAAVYFAFQLN